MAWPIGHVDLSGRFVRRLSFKLMPCSVKFKTANNQISQTVPQIDVGQILNYSTFKNSKTVNTEIIQTTPRGFKDKPHKKKLKLTQF